MSTYQRGELVNVTIDSVGIAEDTDGAVTIEDDNGDHFPLPPQAKIERVAPAQYPRPGEIWRDGAGGLWLAQRYYADFDDKQDRAGANDEGWRVVMVPLNGGPYGHAAGRVQDVHMQYQLIEIVGRFTVPPTGDGGDTR
jgi:hypothetical protein